MKLSGKKVLVMGLGLHGGGVGTVKWLLRKGAKVTVTDLKTKKQLAPSIRALKDAKLFNPEAVNPEAKLLGRSLASARSRSLASVQSTSVASLRFVLGHHSRADILAADLIVQNPGVPNDSPYLKLARKHHIPITNDTALFFQHCPWPIIGVTGTKGKTTTATLLYEILRRHFTVIASDPRERGNPHRVHLAGNLRISPLELLLSHPVILSQVEGSRSRSHQTSNLRPLTSDLVILELSSWNLEGLSRIKQSPHVAVITNLMPDHLNRYSSMRAYIEAKANIFKYQKPRDILVLNRDDATCRFLAKRAKARVVFFNPEAVNPESKLLGRSLDSARSRSLASAHSQKLCFGSFDRSVASAQFFHNRSNIAAALVTARALGVPSKTVNAALASFKGVPGRLESIATIRAVHYINDTTATTPEATIAALTSLSVIPSRVEGSRRTTAKEAPTSRSERSERAINKRNGIVLIAGGGDKKLDYEALAQAIQKHCKALILFKGSASEKILSSLRAKRSNLAHTVIPSRVEGSRLTIVSDLKTMPSALSAARRLAARGDTILLSPGATSFGLFQHEFDRGDQFDRAVRMR